MGTRADVEARRLVDREAELITSAMRLVAAGASRRTVVAGLLKTEAALDVALRGATGLGVRVATIRRSDASGLDVVITRLGPATAA